MTWAKKLRNSQDPNEDSRAQDFTVAFDKRSELITFNSSGWTHVSLCVLCGAANVFNIMKIASRSRGMIY